MGKFTGNSRTAKQINESLILQAILKHGPISRSELVRITHLTSGTISNITSNLLAAGIIKEAGIGESTGGRRPRLLEINSKAWHVVGINVGASKLVAVVTDLEANVLFRADAKIDGSWPVEEQVDQIVRVAEKVIAQSGLDRESFLGAGVGIPGLLDSKAGKSIFSPNLGWRDLMIKDILEERLQLPVMIDNSVRLGALAEKWWGAGRGKKTVIALFVGTGIGAGLILDNKLYRGADEAAGEIGHVTVSHGGEKCNCGKYGCLEAVASGPAIARYARQLIQQGVESSLANMCGGDLEQITGKMVYEAALKDDRLAKEALTRAGRYIGQGIAILVSLFNPDVVVLNGGVMNAYEFLMPSIQEVLRNQVMGGAGRRARLELSELKDTAGPLGGAALVLEQLFVLSGVERVSRVS